VLDEGAAAPLVLLDLGAVVVGCVLLDLVVREVKESEAHTHHRTHTRARDYGIYQRCAQETRERNGEDLSSMLSRVKG
jgi:hypothetical protein